MKCGAPHIAAGGGHLVHVTKDLVVIQKLQAGLRAPSRRPSTPALAAGLLFLLPCALLALPQHPGSAIVRFQQLSLRGAEQLSLGQPRKGNRRTESQRGDSKMSTQKLKIRVG